ncbi:MAG TPA: glycosyltransferase family 4 protein [Bryobacteraceae bacterium]
MLSPEPPWPLNSGGAFRTASLLHYFARFAEVDLILISESGTPAPLPKGLVRSQKVLPLRRHNRSLAARFIRNAGRAIRGVPPLIDRLAGLAAPIEQAIEGRSYDFGIAEHFWCAPYVDQLSTRCKKTVINLHNIESVLHNRYSGVGEGFSNGVSNFLGEQLIRAGQRRFAAASRKLESELLPRFSAVLTTSEHDARLVHEIAPDANVHVYPNSLPWLETPGVEPPADPESPRLVFSANFEYHPNIDAVRFLVGEIWPQIRKRYPALRLRLVGRGDSFIRHLLPSGMALSGTESGTERDTGIEVTGPVEDAQAEIAQAMIVVAPLRAGSGTRLKIIEAWAAARCVVATPLAAEGLAAVDGVNIALAADATTFAETVFRLMEDPAARQRLGTAGRRIFEDNYSWEAVWKRLDIDLQLTHRSGLNRYTGNF